MLPFGTGFKDGEPALGAGNVVVARAEISVRDRDRKEQHVTLRADLPGYAPLLAVATDRNLNRTLAEAKRSDPTDRAPEVDAGAQT